MRIRRSLALLLLAALGLSARPALAHRSLGDADLFVAQTDSFMNALLAQMPEVPSVALAVVVDDQVVLTRAYGTADREHHISATDKTIYYIASATKPFTALAAAILDERGIIDLDSSLASHLTDSPMDLQLVAKDVTLRDLLSHTSGLENDPITTRLAFSGEHTLEQLWNLLSITKANEAGAGNFQYTNFDYNLLTMILDRELGIGWQDLLRDEIFEPAGMKRTTAYASLPPKMGWPMAAPYFGLHPDGIWRIPLQKTDATMQSAGGIMTTARDAARWMLLQINAGRLDGQQLFDASLIRETHRSLVTPTEPVHDLFGLTGCGLGWLEGSCAGQRVLYHTGGYPGFRSLISFMVEPRIGVAVFINEGSIGGRLTEPLAARFYQWWLGQDSPGQGQEIATMLTMRDRYAEAIKADFARRRQRSWQLEASPSAYTGDYESRELGTLHLAREDSSFTVSLGLMHCVAEPYTKPNSMRVELMPGQGEILRFELREGEAVSVDYDGILFRKN